MQSWIITSSEESSTKYTYEFIVSEPVNAGYGVSESPIFNFFFPGQDAPEPPYIIRAFRADSQLVSPVSWCYLINVQVQKTPYLDKTNDDTESGWSRSLNSKETIQNETKLLLISQ